MNNTGNVYQPINNTNGISGINTGYPIAGPSFSGGSYRNTPTYPYFNTPQMQPQNQGTILGRMINDESEITPNEVPMDGRISVFPKSDGSEVIIKSWAQNGTISTMRYVPVIEGDTPNQENNPFSDIIDRLDRIEKRLNTRKTNNHTSYKKEVSNESES